MYRFVRSARSNRPKLGPSPPIRDLEFINFEQDTAHEISLFNGDIPIVTVQKDEDPFYHIYNHNRIVKIWFDLCENYVREDGRIVVTYEKCGTAPNGDILLKGEIDDLRRNFICIIVGIFGVDDVSWVPTKISRGSHHCKNSSGIIIIENICHNL